MILGNNVNSIRIITIRGSTQHSSGDENNQRDEYKMPAGDACCCDRAGLLEGGGAKLGELPGSRAPAACNRVFNLTLLAAHGLGPLQAVWVSPTPKLLCVCVFQLDYLKSIGIPQVVLIPFARVEVFIRIKKSSRQNLPCAQDRRGHL